MTRELLEVHDHGGREEDVERVAELRRLALLAMGNLDDVLAARDQALRQQETSSQFLVVPRRAHRHRHALPTHPNLQRLLARQRVLLTTRRFPPPPAEDFGTHNLRRGKHGGFLIRKAGGQEGRE